MSSGNLKRLFANRGKQLFLKMGRSSVSTEAVHTEISRIQAFLTSSSKETPFSSLSSVHCPKPMQFHWKSDQLKYSDSITPLAKKM